MWALRRLRSDPLGLFAEAAASGADVVEFRAAHRRVFLVIGPQEIGRVTLTNRDNYRKGVSYDALRVPIPETLLTTDGAEMIERRRLLSPLFTRRSVADQIPMMIAAIEACFERWDEFAASGRVIDIAAEMNRLAFDVVGRVLLGAELGPAMTQLGSLIDSASVWVARRTHALVPMPVAVPTPRNRAFRRDEARIRAFIDDLVEDCRQYARGGYVPERRKRGPKGGFADRRKPGRGRYFPERRKRGPEGEFLERREPGSRPDLLSVLLSSSDGVAGPTGGATLDGAELTNEIAGFLMAGHQTTGAALAWTWYLLSRHPRVLARMEAEVDGVPSLRDKDDLEQLTYVSQVVRESMRLYPPGWAFTRTPIGDDQLAGRRVPASSIIVICSYANQRSPRFWPQPLVFDPDRFAPGQPTPEQHQYFPFGVGPRACIGRQLALVESVVALASLARRYRVRPLSDEPPRADAGITLRPADPMPTRIERR